MNIFVDNDISIRPKTGEIRLLDKYTVYQINVIMPPPQMKELKTSTSTTVRLNFKQVVFPALQKIWKETNAVGNVTTHSSSAFERKRTMINSI